MGYELEAPLPPLVSGSIDDDRQQALERRWQRANERLAAALTGYHALHGRVAADDPAWLAAQLRLAQARQCCREASDELELLASSMRWSVSRR
jgi:hypothetical protein